MIDPVLLVAARVQTFSGATPLTNASGFFFEREDRLFLITARHVVIDPDNDHYPDRLEIELHSDREVMAKSFQWSIPLYQDAASIWREGRDSAGPVDIAAVEITRAAMPEGAMIEAFGPQHLMPADARLEIGSTLMVVGFPLGFHDMVHHLPVVRQAGLASPYGLRFQGNGYFLTDARTHRGLSGAPVVFHRAADFDGEDPRLRWSLLGVHSSRVDMRDRDHAIDEALGLNCAWYADILMVLTES